MSDRQRAYARLDYREAGQGGAVAAKAEADVIAKAGPGPPLHPPLPVPGNAHRKRALGREGSPVASHGQPRAAVHASRSAARQADQFNRMDNAAFAFVVNKANVEAPLGNLAEVRRNRVRQRPELRGFGVANHELVIAEHGEARAVGLADAALRLIPKRLLQ